jgi:hypothetical protein
LDDFHFAIVALFPLEISLGPGENHFVHWSIAAANATLKPCSNFTIFKAFFVLFECDFALAVFIGILKGPRTNPIYNGRESGNVVGAFALIFLEKLDKVLVERHQMPDPPWYFDTDRSRSAVSDRSKAD